MATNLDSGFYNLAPTYPSGFNAALSFVTPFTHRTNISYAELLMELYKWLRDQHLPLLDKILKEFFDKYTVDFENLKKDIQMTKDEWQRLFDEFMDDIVNQLEVLNDQAVANLIRNKISETRKALNEEFYSRNIPVNDNILGYRKSIKHNLPLQYPGFDSYVDNWGRNQVPQSFTVDTKTNELFIVYNEPIVVAVYNWTTGAFKTVFRLGDTNNSTVTEGIHVIYEGLARYIYIRTSVGSMSRFNITELPARGTSIIASADYPVTGLGRTSSYDGRYFYVNDSVKRDVIRRLDSGFADNGVIKLPTNMAGWTGENDNSMSTHSPKIQGFTVTSAGLFTSHGGYYQVGNAASPYQLQGLRQYNVHGDLLGEWLVDPNAMAEKFYSSGALMHKPRVFENEGVALVNGEMYTISFTHGYNADEAEIASVEGILIIKEFSTDENAIDFSSNSRNPIVANNSLVGFVKDVRNRILNQVNGQPLTTIVELVEYMGVIEQQYGEYYSSTTNIVDTNGLRIPDGHMVKISMGTAGNFIIDVIGVDSHSRRLYKVGSEWIENRMTTPGAIPLPISLAGVTPQYNPSYRREGNEVALDGGVSLDSSLTPGLTNYHKIGTLPTGYKPGKYQYYPASVAGSPVQAMCRVQMNGDIEISIATATTATVILTGVRFRSTVII